eukprot:scaffold183146_cov39-Prasinocladus_malaysianus.AAC.1
MGMLDVMYRRCTPPPLPLYAAAAAQMARHTAAYTLESLLDLTSVLAKARMESAALSIMESLSHRAVKNITSLSGEQIADLVESFALLGVEAPELFDAVARRVSAEPQQFSSKELSVLMWSYANMVISKPVMFTAVAEYAVTSQLAFDLADLNKLLWAYASMGIKAPNLYTAAATQAVMHEIEGKADSKSRHLASQLYNLAADLTRTFR